MASAKRNRRPARTKPLYGEQATKIRALLAAGKSPAEVSRELGCSRQAVHKAQIQTAAVGAPRTDAESPECPTCGQLAKTAQSRARLRAHKKQISRA